MDIQELSLSAISRYGNNPRNNAAAVEKVAASIREFGWRQPIVVDEAMVIIAGDTRFQAAQPLVVGRYAVAHNGSVENADSLAGAFGFRLQTGNDSEALARLVGALSGTLAQRVDAALVLANTGEGFALAVLDMATGEVVLRRRELPLFVLNTQAGRYWCSIRPDSQWEMLR